MKKKNYMREKNKTRREDTTGNRISIRDATRKKRGLLRRLEVSKEEERQRQVY